MKFVKVDGKGDPNRDPAYKAAVEWLSALACIGLKEDTIDVKFEDYYATGRAAVRPGAAPPPRYSQIDAEIHHGNMNLVTRPGIVVIWT